jgi:predicted RNase H-like nuclease (RuvC/YqgF family)
MNEQFVQNLLTENTNLKEEIHSLNQSNSFLIDRYNQLKIEMEDKIIINHNLDIIQKQISHLASQSNDIYRIVDFIKQIFSIPKVKISKPQKTKSKDERVGDVLFKLQKRKLFNI